MSTIIFNLIFLTFILNNCNNKYIKCISCVKNKDKIETGTSNKNIKLYNKKNFTKTKCISYKNPIDDFIDTKVAMGAYPLAFTFKKPDKS